MEYHFIAICSCSAPGLKHHVAEEYCSESEDSGDHFACITAVKKSEKKPARSKDFDEEWDDAWQELWKKIPDILLFFVLFRFLPILPPPECLHEVGCKQSFHSVLILSLVIISVWCFFFFRVVGGGGGEWSSLQSHASLPLKAQGCCFTLMATGRRSFQMLRSNANLQFFFSVHQTRPSAGFRSSVSWWGSCRRSARLWLPLPGINLLISGEVFWPASVDAARWPRLRRNAMESVLSCSANAN